MVAQQQAAGLLVSRGVDGAVHEGEQLAQEGLVGAAGLEGEGVWVRQW